MTKQELQAHGEKIRALMLEHLTPMGYPDKMTNEQIMGELKPMWVKIEEAGLVLSGMNFTAFANVAHSQFLFAQMNDLIGMA